MGAMLESADLAEDRQDPAFESDVADVPVVIGSSSCRSETRPPKPEASEVEARGTLIGSSRDRSRSDLVA